MTIKAIIFDVDGTLAETEEMHRRPSMKPLRNSGSIGIGIAHSMVSFSK
jgi:beta-phosphoglucomutase-like phosphatase (HAD superfamily)